MSTHSASSDVSFRDAIRDALAEEMRRDARVVLIGEDVGPAGGAFSMAHLCHITACLGLLAL